MANAFVDHCGTEPIVEAEDDDSAHHRGQVLVAHGYCRPKIVKVEHNLQAIKHLQVVELGVMSSVTRGRVSAAQKTQYVSVHTHSLRVYLIKCRRPAAEQIRDIVCRREEQHAAIVR